mgnify:CR=1 FL=1
MTTKLNHAKSFATFKSALEWARTYARESCHPFHFWRVEQAGRDFVVAVRSRNTGRVNGYAC